MIVFDLSCDNSHRFECWFRSSGDFADQKARELLICPTCGSGAVDKAPMAPAVPAKGNRNTSGEKPIARRGAPRPQAMANHPMVPGISPELAPKLARAFATIAKAQAKALAKSEWVGDRFADEVRSMHYGEKAEALVHGRASKGDARDLLEEGIAVAPLLVPVAPPDDVN